MSSDARIAGVEQVAGQVAGRVVERHAELGGLAFGYGQGSVFCGFTEDSDLDIVLIWNRAEVPSADRRPGRALCDPGHEGRAQAYEGMALDNLRIGGWPVDIAHYTRATFDSWCGDVARGDGWQRHAWPLPLHAVAGFVYGVDLTDPTGIAATARAGLGVLPDALVETARAGLVEARAGSAGDLASAARAGDGWLFHSLVTPLIRTAYVAWFAAEGRYCPFPKHVRSWAERFGLDRTLVDLDVRLWTTRTLEARHATALEFIDRILALA